MFLNSKVQYLPSILATLEIFFQFFFCLSFLGIRIFILSPLYLYILGIHNLFDLFSI